MAFTKDQLNAYIQALYDDDGQLSSNDYQLIINYILSNGEPETDPRDLIQVRRGDYADLPNLAQGELAFTLDTESFYIGGLNGNVLLNASDYVNVQKFGAKGDGVKDDTQAIQSAIDYCFSNKKNLFFPAGVYGVTQNFAIKGFTIRGVGKETEIKMLSTGSNDKITPFRMNKTENGDGSELRDLKLNGNVAARFASGELATACAGIQLKQVKNCIIDNVIFEDFGAIGLDINFRGQAITLEARNDATADCSNNIISNCKVMDAGGQLSFAIRLYTDFGGNENWDFATYYVKDNLIKDIYIEGCSKNAVEIVGPNTMHNIIDNVKLINTRGYGGIEVDYGARYNTIKNCVVRGYNPEPQISTDSNTFAPFRSGFAYGSSNSPSKGNMFLNNTAESISSPYDLLVRGIYILGSIDTVVDGLIVRDCNYAGGSKKAHGCNVQASF